MPLDLNAVVVGGKKAKGTGALVKSGVIAQVAKTDARQACISVHGDAALAKHQGNVILALNGTDYRLVKGKDSHALWFTQQGANAADFVAAYNILEATPDVPQGVVKVAD